MPCDRVSAQYIGEIYYLNYSDKHKWYFFSHQSPDEVAIFVSFDSDPRQEVECTCSISVIHKLSDNLKVCAHASFRDHKADPEAAPRQSLEIRAIVVTPNIDRK